MEAFDLMSIFIPFNGTDLVEQGLLKLLKHVPSVMLIDESPRFHSE